MADDDGAFRLTPDVVAALFDRGRRSAFDATLKAAGAMTRSMLLDWLVQQLAAIDVAKTVALPPGGIDDG